MTGNGHLTGTFKVNSGMAQMLRGRVIMDVVNAEQGKIAEVGGAVVVMALESSGGVWDYSLGRKSIAWIM
jgi:pyridoxal 5'-phosphate synthase pdxS subunit